MKLEKLETLSKGAHPMMVDKFHMGTTMGTDIIILHPNHKDEPCPYLIVCNTVTGERVKLVFDDKASDGIKLTELVVNNSRPSMKDWYQKGND